jgi:peptidoglycan/xylan/chitin deacetylase (PgdA/CDA1 family)
VASVIDETGVNVRAGYRGTRALVACIAGSVVVSACAGGGSSGGGTAARSATPTAAASPSPSPAVAVDPASVKANELGSIPVLMYHQFLAKPRGVYDQTIAQFRAELTSLYAHGYRTITAADLVAGHIDVPAGKKPMVLTFDDSTVSQYDELPDGSVKPGTAVAVLLEVAKAAGEDHPVATFYVNGEPFAGHPAYLNHLHDLGMEVAEHTLTHANLKQLDDAGVQAELAKGLKVITDAIPGVQVTTMALPFGVRPRNHVLAAKGRSGGIAYDFAGVFAVGSNPAPSPYSVKFNPMYVPRIRSGLRTGDQSFTSTDWLPQLFSGKVTPYISDGDPQHVSFPKASAAKLSPRFASVARPY